MPAPAARGRAAMDKAAAPTAAPPTPTAGVEEDGSAAARPAPAPPATTAGVTATIVGAPPPTAAGDDAVPADAEVPLAAAAASPDGAEAPTRSPMSTDRRSEDRGSRGQVGRTPRRHASRCSRRWREWGGIRQPAHRKNNSKATRHDSAAGWGVGGGGGSDSRGRENRGHPRVTIKPRGGVGWGGVGWGGCGGSASSPSMDKSGERRRRPFAERADPTKKAGAHKHACTRLGSVQSTRSASTTARAHKRSPAMCLRARARGRLCALAGGVGT